MYETGSHCLPTGFTSMGCGGVRSEEDEVSKHDALGSGVDGIKVSICVPSALGVTFAGVGGFVH